MPDADPHFNNHSEETISTFSFPVRVIRDPGKVLRAEILATVDRDGLSLERDKRQEGAFLGIGTPAEYLERNRFVVEIEGRKVVLAVVTPNGLQKRLAQDLVEFLQDRRGPLRQREYRVPGLWLTAPVMAPLLIPAAALGLALSWEWWWQALLCWSSFWIILGLGLAVLNLIIIKQDYHSLLGRLLATGGIALLGFVGLGLLGWTVSNPMHAPELHWQPFASREGKFRVDFPAAPVVREVRDPRVPSPVQLHLVEMLEHHLVWAVAYVDLPAKEAAGADWEKRLAELLAGRLVHGGRAHNSQAVTVGNLPGRQFQLAGPHTRLVARTCRSGDRLYLVMAGGPWFFTEHPALTDFFASFGLTAGQ